MPMGPKGMVKPDDAELADATVDALWEFLAAGSAELDAAVGTALYVILLVISLLPIARFHSSLLAPSGRLT